MAEDPNTPKLQFYQLHYPPQRKSPSKLSNRSKSVQSVKEAEIASLDSLNAPSKNALKDRKKQQKQYFNIRKEQPNYKEPLTIKKMLSAQYQGPINQQLLSNFVLKDNRDLDQWSRKSMAVRISYQKAKQEKIKANRIILSQKTPQQVKLEYLRRRKQQAQLQKNMQIENIYEQFFRKEYEGVYGSRAFQIFKENIQSVVSSLSNKIIEKSS